MTDDHATDDTGLDDTLPVVELNTDRVCPVRTSEVSITIVFRFAGNHMPSDAGRAAEDALMSGGTGGLITSERVIELARPRIIGRPS